MSDAPPNEPHERLAWARAQAGYKSATDAARAFGWNENTYRSHENGERGLRRKVAETYAKAFHVTPAFLMLGAREGNRSSIVPIIGEAADRGYLNFVGDFDGKDHTHIALPFEVRDEMVAIEVCQDSYLISFQPRDLLLFWFRPFGRIVLDHFSMISTKSGDNLLRILRPGSKPDTFNLEIPSAPVMYDVEVDGVKLLHAIIPGSQWSKISLETGERTNPKWRKG